MAIILHRASKVAIPHRALAKVTCFPSQVFIAEPEMVKLVHFQGYPTPLLPVMVTGVPSMHICLKFIPELVTQSHAQKQVQQNLDTP